ncbi:MFS transporter, putative [Cordyceps militaris CM01]|uniref:MFS transporter, putative n=1 Tax=Cordyceps militaris (strain CM01) TaxID=983644 RepID=G3JTF4_CORMM|nr:MFS transporter, putative [Cordyceps militaris CM01]EGX88301.1 MFS transporter, putative [Cordyceps militaris CM01]
MAVDETAAPLKATGPENEKEKQDAAAKPAPPPAGLPSITYPGVWHYSLLAFALLLAMFLVALDVSIIATAIPTITAEFHSVSQIGWYGSAFFMSLAAFQAFWGKAYKYFALKIVFLSCIGIFEIGSLMAALAPNSNVLILGRAIQGLGGAGITGGCYTIFAFITPPKNMPAILGLSSSVWSCSSVLGPLLGGLFTQDVTWRWCFWVNLPIGGTTMLILLFVFKTPAHSRMAHTTWKEVPFLFDLPGIVTIVAALVCLLVAFEEGGVLRLWTDSVPIGLVVGFVLLMGLLVVIEWKQGEKAMIVLRIMKRRTILILALFNLTAQAAGFARTYNLPIYFQAVQGVSPSQSGIRMLPTVLTTSLFSFIGSVALGKLGYYQPFLLVGAVFLTIGSGMLYTLGPESSAAHYIGYQILASIGSGLVIQINVVVAQAITPRPDMAVTIALVLLWQFVGGTIGVSAAQNILNNVLLKSLPVNSPNITAAKVLAAGTTSLHDAFPDPADFSTVVNAYMNGIRAAWIWGIILSGLAFLIAFGAEWRSIKVEDVQKRTEEKPATSQA